MTSLFVTLTADASTAQPTPSLQSGDGKRAAYSIDELTALKKSLHERGLTLREFLRTRRPGITACATRTPTADEVFSSPNKPPAPPSEQLQARRAYLAARQEEREYGTLISSVQQHVIAERERESFSTFRQQAGLGANFLASILTATLLGYFVGRVYGNGDKVGMLLLCCLCLFVLC